MMYEQQNLTMIRKQDHLAIFRAGPVDARWATSFLECVHFIPCSLPECALHEIDLSTTYAGHSFRAPLFITGITGGTAEAAEINRTLAAIAEEYGIGFGLGSQRAMVNDASLAMTYTVRDVAPHAFIAGNIGAVQAARCSSDTVRRLVEVVSADALCIHLNPAQELLQSEGDRDFRGILPAIERLVRDLPVPVIVKETGAGIARETAVRLRNAGVRYLDVSGVGGTSWTGVEIVRARREKDPQVTAFWDWGIPTAAAVCETRDLGMEIIASGGIRTGLDAARALAIGAKLAGFASPVLRAFYAGGAAEVRRYIEAVIEGIKRTLLLTGCRSVAGLPSIPRLIKDPLREWLTERGIGARNV